MTGSRLFIAALIVLGTAAGPSRAQKSQKKVDPTGTWRWEWDFRGRTVKDAFRLSLSKDGKLIGKLHRGPRTFDVRKGKIDGDKLSFEVSGNFRGTDWTSEYAGVISGDQLKGNVILTAAGNSFDSEWNPKRSVQVDDVVGGWTIHLSVNGQEYSPTLRITQDQQRVKGRYHSSDGTEQDVTSLAVKDNKLTFQVIIERSGRELTLIYSGRPYGARIRQGTVDLNGGAYSLDFTAERVPSENEKQKSGNQ